MSLTGALLTQEKLGTDASTALFCIGRTQLVRGISETIRHRRKLDSFFRDKSRRGLHLATFSCFYRIRSLSIFGENGYCL